MPRKKIVEVKAAPSASGRPHVRAVAQDDGSVLLELGHGMPGEEELGFTVDARFAFGPDEALELAEELSNVARVARHNSGVYAV